MTNKDTFTKQYGTHGPAKGSGPEEGGGQYDHLVKMQ